MFFVFLLFSREYNAFDFERMSVFPNVISAIKEIYFEITPRSCFKKNKFNVYNKSYHLVKIIGVHCQHQIRA